MPHVRGGVPEAIDAFTADGDYYNDGSSNQPVIVYGGGGTSGTGWVSNGSVSTSTSSDNKYKSDDILDLNDAINLAKDGVLYSSDTKVNSALSDVDNLLRINPDWGDAKTVKEILERYLELKNNLIPSLEKEISSIEAKIAELTRQIAEQEKVVAEKKAIVDEKQKILDEYDKKLADLEGKIKAGLASDAEKAEYQRLLVEREQAFADWQAAMDAYNKALKKLNDLIAEKEYYEALLASKKTLLEQYKKELEDLKQQITKIKSSGYRDAPYTQRWLVKEGTNGYDAYQDIIQYLKPNQTYKFTGKFGDQYYYEEDEAYLTIAFEPYVKEPKVSGYYLLAGGTSQYNTWGGSINFFQMCDRYGGPLNWGIYHPWVYDNTGISGSYVDYFGNTWPFEYGQYLSCGKTTYNPDTDRFSREWVVVKPDDTYGEAGLSMKYVSNAYVFRIKCNRGSMNRTYVCEHRTYSGSNRLSTGVPHGGKWYMSDEWASFGYFENKFKTKLNDMSVAKGKTNWIGNLPKVDIVLSANQTQYIQPSDTD